MYPGIGIGISPDLQQSEDAAAGGGSGYPGHPNDFGHWDMSDANDPSRVILNGSDIQQVINQVNIHDLSQPTALQQPAVASAVVNGLDGASFDHLDSENLNYFPGGVKQDFIPEPFDNVRTILWAVFNPLSLTQDEFFLDMRWDSGGNVTRMSLERNIGTPVVHFRTNNQIDRVSLGAATGYSYVVAEFRNAGGAARYRVRLNGAQVVEAPIGAAMQQIGVLSALGVGGRERGSGWCGGTISEFGIILGGGDVYLTAGELTTLEGYIQTKYGL